MSAACYKKSSNSFTLQNAQVATKIPASTPQIAFNEALRLITLATDKIE